MDYAKTLPDGTLELASEALLDGRAVENEDGTWTLGLSADVVAKRLGYKTLVDEVGAEPPEHVPWGQYVEVVVDETPTEIRRSWKVVDRPADEIQVTLTSHINSVADRALARLGDDVLAALETGAAPPQAAVKKRAAIRNRRDQLLAMVQKASVADLLAKTDDDFDPSKVTS